jgi:hypothetical protein
VRTNLHVRPILKATTSQVPIIYTGKLLSILLQVSLIPTLQKMSITYQLQVSTIEVISICKSISNNLSQA